MKIFVTGGEGYIGSAVVSELIRAGDEVVVIDLGMASKTPSWL